MKYQYYNLEAESAVLGTILINNDIFDEINDIIKPEYFYVYEYQEVYKLITTIISKGQKAEVITVSQLAALNSSLKDIINVKYLTDLITSIPNFDSVKEYAEIIKDNYIRRELVELLNNTSTSITTFDNAIDAIKSIEVDIFQLAEHYFVGSSIKKFGDSLELALNTATAAKQRGGISGIATYFKDLDTHLGGLQKSDLIVVAGRPAMGKTALVTNIAYNVAGIDDNNAVLFFSLEMSAEQLASRILAQETNITSDALRKGLFNDKDFNKLVAAVTTLKNKPLFIDDSPVLTVSELRSKARRFKRNNNLSLVVVDYLQLMSGNRRNDNRIVELSEITRGLKAVAKELNIPIIALSQLSRAVEAREDKKPVLSDLRESGTIEQDADVVAFIYREEYYLQRGEPILPPNEDKTKNEAWQKWFSKLQKVQNLATLLLAKNRHGATTNINLRFNAKFTKFEDLDKVHITS